MSNVNITPAPLPTSIRLQIVKKVTIPFFIIPEDGNPCYLRFDTPIEPDQSSFSDRVRKGRKDENGQTNDQPMRIAKVTDIMTGEVCRLVAHSVLESTLDESYPEKSYVGRIFAITKSKAKGKRYFAFNIDEMQIVEDAPVPDAPAAQQSAPASQTRKR